MENRINQECIADLFSIIAELKTTSNDADLSTSDTPLVDRLEAAARKLFPEHTSAALVNVDRAEQVEGSSSADCEICGHPWGEHEFGVPAPECPGPPLALLPSASNGVAAENEVTSARNPSSLTELITSMQESSAQSKKMFEAVLVYGREFALHDEEAAFLERLSSQICKDHAMMGACQQCHENGLDAADLLRRRLALKKSSEK